MDTSEIRNRFLAHFEAAGHLVVASAEPNEVWRWCWVDSELG